MNTTALENLLVHVRPHVPNASDLTLLRELRSATIEFCRRSEVWDQTLSFPAVTVGEPYYELTTPDQSMIQVYHQVWLDGDEEPLDLATDEERLYYTDNADPWGYLPVQGNALYLVPPPQTALGLRAKVSLIPTATADYVPQFLADRWGHEIAAGALARIMAIPGENTYRPDSVAYQRVLFDSAIADAKGDRELGYSNGPIRARLPKS